MAGALLALPDRPAGATVVSAPDAEARAFWERLGFRPADDEGCTHRLDTRRTG